MRASALDLCATALASILFLSLAPTTQARHVDQVVEHPLKQIRATNHSMEPWFYGVESTL